MKSFHFASVSPLRSSITFLLAAAAVTQLAGCAHHPKAKEGRKPSQTYDDPSSTPPESISSEPDGQDNYPVSIDFPCVVRDQLSYFFCYKQGEIISDRTEISPGTFVEGPRRDSDNSIVHGFTSHNDEGPNSIVTRGRNEDWQATKGSQTSAFIRKIRKDVSLGR